MADIKVQKKDGRLEPFNRNKILGGLIKSGTTAEQAESIASQAEAWAQQGAIDGIVKSLDLRNKVLELLRPVNLPAAAAFGSYQKAKPAQPVA